MASQVESTSAEVSDDWQIFHAVQAVAKSLDILLNGEDYVERGIGEPKTGFVLLLFPHGDTSGRTNYVSNGASRADIIKMFEEHIRIFTGESSSTEWSFHSLNDNNDA